jgi:hypothetical protein
MAQTLIDRWAASRGLAASRSGSGRVSLTIDDKYRVHLYDAPNRKVAIEARVRDLPAERAERDHIVQQAAEIATARMRNDAAILAVDPQEGTLLLQAEVPADSPEDTLDDAIRAFAISLSFWRRVA